MFDETFVTRVLWNTNTEKMIKGYRNDLQDVT